MTAVGVRVPRALVFHILQPSWEVCLHTGGARVEGPWHQQSPPEPLCFFSVIAQDAALGETAATREPAVS